ncbi:MAG: ABC-F family ATP-binding cassette domain-containing protein [Alphaproteobacteria bacterium]|nr:ABC-F family ATP-binding cassette domain-containing protein [Alphaproteobacteria bacterium]MBV9062731.1 ABC-F family ATP-binding cassette domain-containing protein [Alphaproteobacteria bacterium]
MPAPLIQLQDIRIRFGNSQVLDGAALSIEAGDRLCLVGRNGSGKSTLLKIAAGLLEPDSGSRFAQPGAAIRYLEQEPDFSGYPTTRDYVETGLGEGYDSDRTFHLLGKLGLTGRETPQQLSGGEKRRAALARALAPEPDILLLDEPTNHLDLLAIEWLEGELASLPSALVLISHDRRFLEDMSRATVWLDRGRTRRLERSFAHFENWRDELLAQEELEQHKLDRKIAAEEDWVRYGVSGRRKRNQGRLAKLQQLRTARRERIRAAGAVQFAAAESESGSAKLIEARNLSTSYDGRCIVRDFSICIARNDRVGIIGPNGAGKTTLLKLLTGELAPDTGTVNRAATLEFAVLEQSRAPLHPDTMVSAVLTGGSGDTVDVRGEKRHVVSYLKDFLFTPQQARTPVRILSGGERARLMLAKILARPSNMLVLDEPTNDLDLETIDLLEEMLASYPGTVLVVSHDRDFLDRVVTSVLRVERGGRFVEYAGGYSDMLAQLPKPEETSSASPKWKQASAAAPRPRAQRQGQQRRLSFHEQHALKTLPGEIAGLESEIAALHDRLADAGLYARDPAAFAAASAKLKDCEAALSEAEERWLELAALEEELGRV